MTVTAATGDVLTASAVDLARDIREGRRTSREVVEAHIARLEAAQRRTNAIVVPLYDRAREAADRADAATGERPPLHGVPCTIKEAFAVEGLPNTAGLVSRKGQVADTTAPAAQRLIDAGAIPLGLTNTSELCMWYESSNRVYGRTSSAYGRRRTAGGSSGGEGAAVGSGGSPFGLGADVGGSIRMPAFFNGVFGHKPTPGMVPNEGQVPKSSEPVGDLLGTGPITRRAGDLMPLLRILAGDEHASQLGDPESVEMRGLPVLVVDLPGLVPPRAPVRAAVSRAAEHLREAGAVVRPFRDRRFARAFELWAAALGTAEEVPFAEMLGGGERQPAAGLVRDFMLGRSPHTFPAVFLAVTEGFNGLAPRRTQRLVEQGRELAEEVHDAIGDGVMLYPTHPRLAPVHHRALLNPLSASYTMLFNVLGTPVTQVPLGLVRGGLPTGVQVATRPGQDHVSVAVALELERRAGGWVPPVATA